MRDLVDDKNVKVDALLLQEVVHVRYELVQLGRHVPKRHQDPKPVLPRFDRPAVQKRVQLQFRVDVPAAAVTRTEREDVVVYVCDSDETEGVSEELPRARPGVRESRQDRVGGRGERLCKVERIDARDRLCRRGVSIRL